MGTAFEEEKEKNENQNQNQNRTTMEHRPTKHTKTITKRPTIIFQILQRTCMTDL